MSVRLSFIHCTFASYMCNIRNYMCGRTHPLTVLPPVVVRDRQPGGDVGWFSSGQSGRRGHLERTKEKRYFAGWCLLSVGALLHYWLLMTIQPFLGK